MAKDVHGVVSQDEWQRIGREDIDRRARRREIDVGGSLLTALAGLLILAMLVVGPMWTLIDYQGAHGPEFERLWLLPFGLTLAAGVPLGLALARERSTGRFALVAFLVASLAVQLATCPWF